MQTSQTKDFRYSHNYAGVWPREELSISTWFSSRQPDLADPVKLSIEDKVFFEIPREFFEKACRRSFSLNGKTYEFQIVGLNGDRYAMWNGPLKGRDITEYIVS